MGRKYISQIDSNNFVYPNNKVSEYDLEIVHDINDNCVDGTVSSVTVSSSSSTGITLSVSLDWTRNNAEVFIAPNGNLNLWSFHLMTPDQDYYKPFILVTGYTSSTTTLTGSTFTGNISIVPSQVGLTSFVNGVYYFEFRFIGKKCVDVVCGNFTVSLPTPTPTPTPTNTLTPTPTPTLTPTPTPSSYCGTQCRNWQYNNVPVGGDVIYYFRCSDGAAQTIAVGEGDTGTFCNCNTSGNPTTDNGTQLTEIGSC